MIGEVDKLKTDQGLDGCLDGMTQVAQSPMRP